ncbi:MAG: 23S rRNA (uracil(1939)-C(5))-methyltransferase RlmD [Bacteroidales bacterium]|nr:23S rRNA (uracil(1939)-C(5))-methyltransferase RlmD [Bacteroidales bacterium]
MSRKKVDILIENAVIEAVAAEGKALTHYEGIVVFVEFAVPGDVVDIRVTKKKKNHWEGFVSRMVKPSENRLEPFCPHFGVCGGCKWQPLPYEMQLAAKQQQVYDQLVRIGHLDIPEISPILGSEKTEYYRNKLEFTFSNRRWEKKPLEEGEAAQPGLGFHVGKYFDKVLDIEDCHLQADPSNAIRNFIRSYALEKGLSFYNIRENRGYLRNIIIRSTQTGNIMLIVVISDDDDPAKRERFLDSISKEFPQISSLYYVINSKLNDSISDLQPALYRGNDAIYEEMEGLHFKIGPKSFYQTNSRQAYRLYSVTREFAGLTGNEVVYDLYTGTGTIAQFVSGKASKVIGIEYVPEAIEDAVLNAANNGITNCEFFAGDMKDILTADFIGEHGKPDVIILDPPRAGIHPDVASVILETAPSRMVYVSCNPASQARDLAILSQKYTIEAVQPVDMFPHTQHVENVCKLKLKEK